ncbi:MAG: L-glutamate gamma-semialdehyde dehydrogenase [Nitrospirales bacterium]|nr:MAG: L-glutamate gamma-semialdehyde dehydrogenase [Nitrospirales bacterium]
MALVSPEVLETSIQDIGRTLHDRSRRFTLNIFHHRRIINLLLDWGTRDEELKVQLFRFVDVLPTLETDQQFIQVFKEYFQDLAVLPSPVRRLIHETPANSLRARIGTRFLRRQFLKTAETFMAGHSAEDAKATLSHLWKSGCGYSVDLLGEATVSEAEADHYRDRCLATLRFLNEETQGWESQPRLEKDHIGPLPRVQLSLKVSALYSQLDPIDPEGSYEGVAQRLRPILDLATDLPAAITFDMEQAELKDLTIKIFTRILSESSYSSYPYAAIALQAYLKETAQDLEDLLIWVRKRGTPIGIRLVKGAYWDSETVQYQQRRWPIPVFLNKAETDINFESLSQVLLKNLDVLRPAFGTHNLRTLAHTQALVETLHLPQEACEYQMLFGMTDGLQEAAIDAGFRMRVYTPVGELIPGMAYLVRRLLENTANEGFIHQHHATNTSIEGLLAPPQVQDSSPSPQSQHPQASHVSTDRQDFQNEPLTDFSQQDLHVPIKQALTHIRQQLGKAWVYPVPTGVTPSGPELLTVNPSQPEEIIARFQSLRPHDIHIMIESAKAAMNMWRLTPVSARIEILFNTASLMRARRSELIAWEIFETGKPWREADADVAEAIDFLEFYGRDMRRIVKLPPLRSEPGEYNQLHHRPRGIAAIIAPWNFSLAIPTGMVSAALVTGNIVLFKPSERSTMVGYQLYNLFREAGIPEHVLHFLPGGPELGQALVSHPDVHLIAFTGSKEVGIQIMSSASHIVAGQQHLKHVIAEMGGKNAIIVDETADLDQAVTGILDSATGYQGQKCSACSRLIVLDSIHDTLVDRLKQAALSLQIGSPEHPHHRMGPLIDARALERVRHFIAIGKKEGRCILDLPVTGPGFFQGPAIFTEIEPHHRLAQEEIFGPVLAIMNAKNFLQALDLANGTPYALTGGVYSRSPANIQRACDTFDVGNLYINRPISGALVGRQPFGGHRMSGIGMKAGGENYLLQFMIERVMSENTLRRGFAPSP